MSIQFIIPKAIVNMNFPPDFFLLENSTLIWKKTVSFHMITGYHATTVKLLFTSEIFDGIIKYLLSAGPCHCPVEVL